MEHTKFGENMNNRLSIYILTVLIFFVNSCGRNNPTAVSLLSMTNAWECAGKESESIVEMAKAIAQKADKSRCKALKDFFLCYCKGKEILAVVEMKREYFFDSYIIFVVTKDEVFECRYTKNIRVVNRLQIPDPNALRKHIAQLRNFTYSKAMVGYHITPFIAVHVTLYEDNQPIEMLLRPHTVNKKAYIDPENVQSQAFYAVLEMLDNAPREMLNSGTLAEVFEL